MTRELNPQGKNKTTHLHPEVPGGVRAEANPSWLSGQSILLAYMSTLKSAAQAVDSSPREPAVPRTLATLLLAVRSDHKVGTVQQDSIKSFIVCEIGALSANSQATEGPSPGERRFAITVFTQTISLTNGGFDRSTTGRCIPEIHRRQTIIYPHSLTLSIRKREKARNIQLFDRGGRQS